MNRFQFKNIIFTLILSVMFSTFLKAQTAQATIIQDNRITQLVDLHSKMILADKLSDRYKIQLFSGNATAASAILKKYRNRLGTWSSSIKHETPNYKVWVGNYRNKLEAERALIDIHKEFPKAFIFKPAR